MMFKLAQGPWTKLFEGTIEGQSVEIHSNEESMLLVLIFEKEQDKNVGLVIQLYKVFVCEGEIEAFVETLPKDAMVLLKHTGKKTMKFFVLGSEPGYAKFEESAVQDEFDMLLKKTISTSKTVKDISKAYELGLTEIRDAGEEEKQAFFAEPFSLQMLSRAGGGTKHQETAQAPGFAGELLLGLTKDGAIVKEPLQLFNRTIITGFGEKLRMHIAHLFIESTLTSNLAAVVIDWKNSFRGLAEPTRDLQGLRKFKVDFEPIGFPVAHFTVPENVKIDLGTVDIPGMLELFGAGTNVVTQIIGQQNSMKKFSSVQELVEEIKKTEPTEEASSYRINKAVRIMSLFELHYPKLFDGQNNFDEIAKSWMKGLGRAGVVHLENTDEKTSLLIVHCIVRGMLAHFKKQGQTNLLRAMIIIPETKRILSATAQNQISKLIVGDLNELGNYGVGFVLSSEKATELSQEIVLKSEAEIGIIEKNDVGIKIKNRKNYRALLRPGLSTCTEM